MLTMNGKRTTTPLLLVLLAGVLQCASVQGSKESLRRQQQQELNRTAAANALLDDKERLYLLLTAVSAGILLILSLIWLRFFRTPSSREECLTLQKGGTVTLKTFHVSETVGPASDTSHSGTSIPHHEEFSQDGSMSVESSRPVAHVHLEDHGPTTPSRSNSAEGLSIAEQSFGQDSMGSNMFVFLSGLRRATNQLEGTRIEFQVHDNEAQSQPTLTTKLNNKIAEENPGVPTSLDSLHDFFRDVETGDFEDSCDDDDDDDDDDINDEVYYSTLLSDDTLCQVVQPPKPKSVNAT